MVRNKNGGNGIPQQIHGKFASALEDFCVDFVVVTNSGGI